MQKTRNTGSIPGLGRSPGRGHDNAGLVHQGACDGYALSLAAAQFVGLVIGALAETPVPGILQARTLEWVAISFSNA